MKVKGLEQVRPFADIIVHHKLNPIARDGLSDGAGEPLGLGKHLPSYSFVKFGKRSIVPFGKNETMPLRKGKKRHHG